MWIFRVIRWTIRIYESRNWWIVNQCSGFIVYFDITASNVNNFTISYMRVYVTLYFEPNKYGGVVRPLDVLLVSHSYREVGRACCSGAKLPSGRQKQRSADRDTAHKGLWVNRPPPLYT